VQDDEQPMRLLPELTPETTPFWSGGAEGKLLITRCQACGHWIHPPQPICPVCLSRDVKPEAVSGDAEVHSFTINYHPFLPNVKLPFAIAIVEFPEQAGMRMTTNIVGYAPEDVFIGMKVHVEFLQQDDVWLPLFRPVDSLQAE